MVIVLPLIHVARAQNFAAVGTLTLNQDETSLLSAITNPNTGYAYFATATGIVVEVRLSDFVRVASLGVGQLNLVSAVMDSADGYAYFGTDNPPGITTPSFVVKIRLSDFTLVGSLQLKSGEENLESAIIDTLNGFAYFGTNTNPGTVVKISLSDFTEVGSLVLKPGEKGLVSAVIDSANGFAYFGTNTNPGTVVKVRLSDFTEFGSLILSQGESDLTCAVIDSENGYAYFGTNTYPGVVVKINLVDFVRIGAVTLNTGENQLFAGVIDPRNGFGYFGTFASPASIVKINLSDLTRVGALNPGVDWLESGIIDSASGFAYFGNDDRIVLKIETVAHPTPPRPFDYSLWNSGQAAIRAGSSGNVTITVLKESGPSQPVNLNCVSSTMPTGITCLYFSADPVFPTGTTVLTVGVAPRVVAGFYSFQVTGSLLGPTNPSTTVSLAVFSTSDDAATPNILGLQPSAFYAIVGTVVIVSAVSGSVAYRASKASAEKVRRSN